MLRKILPISAAIFGMTMLPNSAQAVTAQAAANAVVLTPIAIAKDNDMSFGSMFPTAAAGTVILGTDDSRTEANVTLGPSTGTAATFTVTGTASATYAITLPASAVLNDGGVNDMTANAFTHDAGGTPTIGGGGSSTLKVGSTLNVGANQVAGSYTVNFDVTVDYN